MNTFDPQPEADFLFDQELVHGIQLVLNIQNQEALHIVGWAAKSGHGVIVRMPFQFGLLTGKFSKATRFPPDDHRKFRLPPDLLDKPIDALGQVWPLAEKYAVSEAQLALSFILGFKGFLL